MERVMRIRLNPQPAVFAVACLILGIASQGCGRRLDAGPQPDIARGKALREGLASTGSATASAGDDAAAGGDSTGWGTLSATFKYVGTAPKPAAIEASKDPEVCGKHPLHDESLEVGSDGGVANIVVWLRTKVTPNPELMAKVDEAKDVVLDNKNCRFEPHVVVLTTKQKLEIKNSDPVGHNSNGAMQANPPFNPIIPAGQSAEIPLPKEESLPAKVGCSIHPWMGSWVVVRNDPYAAVSNKEGYLTLKDLPAGKELEFQLWQEKVTFLKDVEVQGIKVDSKGRFKLKLTPGEDRKLEFKVSIK
jgi:hypothetical protein